ncbi:MAG: acyclic terpene utilization AtuA family protein [Parvibaculales bacterium]
MKKIRIAGASGYWGDSMMATSQFLATSRPDYIVYDFLAEITMSIMARARAAKPEAGYATDFVTAAMKPNLKEIATQGVKIVSNAGGVNPLACGQAVEALIAEQGLALSVAVITGDDILEHKSALEQAGVTDMFSGAAFPPVDDLVSMNAYLGAFPIAEALARGADIVITGRCVDSAVTLGPCIHEFGWRAEDYDRLAAGSLAGHIIECGPQATGGNFTDWRDVPAIDHIGYPFIDIDAGGNFDVSKPEGTGGLVSVGTVSEQMLYEIGDPQAYELPDVCCDFSAVQITQAGDDVVHVSHARGAAPSDKLKVSATFFDGFRAGTLLSFVGHECGEKAAHFAEMVVARTRQVLRERNLADFTETSVEVLGADSHYGADATDAEGREVVLKLAIKHPDQKGAGIFLKEVSGMSLATPPGLAMFAGARPKPSPVVRLFSFLTAKEALTVEIHLSGEVVIFTPDTPSTSEQAPVPVPTPKPTSMPDTPDMQGEMTEVPLIKLAWGRSGDKGNKANIGIIARQAAYLPYIWHSLDESVLADRFAHFIDADRPASAVVRYLLPGSHAINFLIDKVLGGGGVASLRNDPQGKAFAQILLDQPISIPTHMAETL